MGAETHAHPAPLPRAPVAPVWRSVIGALGVVAVFWALCLIDRAAYHALLAPETERWLGVRALKFLGTMWPWLALGAVLCLIDARAARANPAGAWWRRAAALVGGAAGGGALAEVLKIVFRRVRPEHFDGAHAFRPFSDRPFYAGGLDLPSSHAGTAFGAAFGLALLFPRLTPLWVAMGAACAMSRVLEGAHFVSSVFLAGAIAWAWSRCVGRLLGVRAC